MGDYAVPKHIRDMKPKGTMVKKINNNYYVYSFTSTKNSKGNWGIKIGNIIGSIKEDIGFIPNESFNSHEDITTCEYGEYFIPFHLTSNILDLLKETFNPFDAIQIYLISLFYFVEGYFGLTLLEDYFNQSYFKIKYPSISMSYYKISKLIDSLGRRQNNVISFQKNLISKAKEMAIDGHDIESYSNNNDLTEYGNKYNKTGKEQFNLLMAYDIESSKPVLSKIYPGSILDKISIKDIISTYSLKNKLFIIDSGFYSKENIELFSSEGNKYIIPLSMNLTKYKDIVDNIEYKNPFLYTNGNKQEPIFYSEKYIDNQNRIIAFKNINQNIIESKDYENKIGINENFTLEEYEKLKDKFGVIVLQTSCKDEAQVIYEKYKRRWKIETFFNSLKNSNEFTSFNQSDYYMLQGLSFIMLITGLIESEFKNKTKKIKEKKNEILVKSKFVKLIKEGNKWKYGNYSKQTRELFKSLDIDITKEAIL